MNNQINHSIVSIIMHISPIVLRFYIQHAANSVNTLRKENKCETVWFLVVAASRH